LIDDLTGRAPSEAAPQASLTETVLPLDLPVSLPAKLVEQRPDVRAAEANLHAASAQVGVAIAARLPNFNISGNAGGASNTIGTLFSHGNSFWSIGGDVAQPIFEGGALLHRQKAAEASLDQAKAQYRSTVLAALQNVADTLQALNADARALSAAAASESAAAESLTIAKRQLELGQISGLAVTTAEQTYQQAVLVRIQARAARFADTVALFEALGGGWWNRPDQYATG
jgi:NodT family efflux transporter outer membrane factor (OMF) lipoprotein